MLAVPDKDVLDVSKLISLMKDKPTHCDITREDYRLTGQKPLAWKDIAQQLQSESSIRMKLFIVMTLS